MSVTSQQDTLISSYYMHNDTSQVEITEVFEIEETTAIPYGDMHPTVEIEEIYDDIPPEKLFSPKPLVTETWEPMLSNTLVDQTLVTF